MIKVTLNKLKKEKEKKKRKKHSNWLGKKINRSMKNYNRSDKGKGKKMKKNKLEPQGNRKKKE